MVVGEKGWKCGVKEVGLRADRAAIVGSGGNLHRYLYLCGEGKRKRQRIAFQMVEVMGTVNVKHETYISANRSVGSIMSLVEVICGCPGGSIYLCSTGISRSIFNGIAPCNWKV